jgi:hypothetical protein
VFCGPVGGDPSWISRVTQSLWKSVVCAELEAGKCVIVVVLRVDSKCRGKKFGCVVEYILRHLNEQR